jgi:IS5 family transposase
MHGMQQTVLRLGLSMKRTRRRELLAQMEQVVPWADLMQLVSQYAPQRKTGRPPFDVLTMLRIHFMQQSFTLNDPAIEEALHDVPLFRDFAGRTLGRCLPDETTILRFRHLLEQHKRAEQRLATQVRHLPAQIGPTWASEVQSQQALGRSPAPIFKNACSDNSC